MVKGLGMWALVEMQVIRIDREEVVDEYEKLAAEVLKAKKGWKQYFVLGYVGKKKAKLAAVEDKLRSIDQKLFELKEEFKRHIFEISKTLYKDRM